MSYRWLDDQIEAACTQARQLGLDFTWEQERETTETQIRSCEELIGFDWPLRIGAFSLAAIVFVYSFDIEPDSSGNTGLLLSTGDIAKEYCRMRDFYENPEFQEGLPDDPTTWWSSLIPTLDVHDVNFCVSDPHQTSDGEYAVLYADHELGPEWWRREKPLSVSFEQSLKNMFRAYLVDQRTPELWRGPIALI